MEEQKNNVNPKTQLFTEMLRPKKLEQAIIVPRIQEELSKGLVDNILFYGSPGTGKCLDYHEAITVVFDIALKNEFINFLKPEIDYWNLKPYEKCANKFWQADMAIGDVFKLQNIKENLYETPQTGKYSLYVEYDGELSPIMGYVKKKVLMYRYTMVPLNAPDYELYVQCSNKHIMIDENGNNVLMCDAKLVQNVDYGLCAVSASVPLGDKDAYDIALPFPHLYTTTNGFIHHNTTLSRIMASDADSPLFINASVERGIDVIREKVINYASAASLFGGAERLKAVVLEECDNLTADAWSSLRATIEQFHSNCRFIANCNYIDKVPEPIQSRFNCIPIEAQNQEEENYLVSQYIERVKKYLTALKFTYTDDAVARFVQNDFPDMRTLIKKIQQLYTRGVTVLSAENLGSSFDCSDIFTMIMSAPDPWNNYKTLSGKWSNKAEDAIIIIGQKFPEYLQTVAPDKMNKLPLVVIAISEYNAQLATSVDKFVTLLALVYKLQMIINN